MPYIAIKCYPKDEAVKKEVAKEITDTFTKLWGCPKTAISISFEEVDPSDWNKVEEKEIKPNQDKMYVLSGEETK